MNSYKLKLPVVFMAAALAAQILVAQDKHNTSPVPGQVALSKLKGAQVKSNTGEDLGKLEDILIDPRTGKVTFAVVGKGGLIGLGEKRRPVPWQDVTINSNKQIMLNISKDKLQAGPAIDNEESEMDSPAFVVTVYEFYGVEPSAVGTPGESSSGTGKESIRR